MATWCCSSHPVKTQEVCKCSLGLCVHGVPGSGEETNIQGLGLLTDVQHGLEEDEGWQNKTTALLGTDE